MLRCGRCGEEADAGPTYPPRCRCGGLWGAVVDPDAPPAYDRERAGMRAIPLWPDPIDPGLFWKREDLNPTGSFKDRGAESLVLAARRAGATSLVLDSSGGAALAAARVAAREGLPLTLHIPGDASPSRRHSLGMFGATVVAAGSREDAARRAATDAAHAFWFSHVMHPAFFLGTAESGREVLETPGRASGEAWIVPVGNGSLLLGLDMALARGRRTDIRLVAAQTAACAGLVDEVRRGTSCAAGIAIANPPRREEILGALRRRDGEVLVVTEDEITDAWYALARRGVLAEPASAAALAAARRIRERGGRAPLVGWLTGAGSRG